MNETDCIQEEAVPSPNQQKDQWEGANDQLILNKSKINFYKEYITKHIVAYLVNLMPIMKWSLLFPPKSAWKSEGFEDFWGFGPSFSSASSSSPVPVPNSSKNRSLFSTLIYQRKSRLMNFIIRKLQYNVINKAGCARQISIWHWRL